MAGFVFPSQMDDQDAAPAAPSAAPSAPGGNKPFLFPSQMDEQGKPYEPDATAMSVAQQIPAGLNSAIAGAAGAPVDVANWALGHILHNPFSTAPAQPLVQDPIGGSGTFKRMMGVIGANPDDRPANNVPERIARGVGEGIGGAMMPEAMLAGVGRIGQAATAARAGEAGRTLLTGAPVAAPIAPMLPRTTEALQGAFGSALSVPSVAGNALAGGVGGGTGQAASELVPDQYKPLAGMVGGMAGGMGAAAAGHYGGQLGQKGIAAVNDYRQPFAGKAAPVLDDSGKPIIGSDGNVLMAKPGQLDDAARIVAGNATDAPAALDALQQPRQIVPGSNPTTGPAAEDSGLSALEKQVANTDLKSASQFNDARAKQNTARVAAINNTQAVGDPTDVSKSLLDQLAAIDAQHAANEAGARNVQSNALAAVGGTDTPENIGNAARGSAADGRAAIKQKESALWDAIDPENKLAVPMGEVQQAAKDAYGNLPKADAANLSGPEQKYSSLIKSFNSVEPLSELTSLRSNLAADMREELTNKGKTPTWKRMSDIMGSIHDVLGTAIEQSAMHDNHAVAAGAMAPEDTTASRLGNVFDGDARQSRPDTGSNAASVGNDAGNLPAVGASSGTGGIRTAGEAPGRSAQAPSDSAVSPAAPRGSSVEPSPPKAFSDAKYIGTNAEGQAVFERPNGQRIAVREDGYALSQMARSADHREYVPATFETEPGSRWDVVSPSAPGVRSGRPPEQAPLFDPSEVTSRPQRPDSQRPLDIEGFIRSQGGIQDRNGDLKSMGMKHLIAKPGQGLSADAMREAAAEAGYLGPNIDHAMANTDINDLYDKLGSETPVHSVHDEQAASDWAGYDAENEQYNRVKGPASKSAAPPVAPISAYRTEDAYPPGMSPEEVRAGQLQPNYPQSAVDRAAQAAAVTKERAKTFDQGPVGKVLKQRGTSGNFDAPDSRVPGMIFKPGPEGFEVAKAYLKAAGGQADGLANLHEAGAMSMRRVAVDRDGNVDPGKLEGWLKAHDDALRAVPGLRAKVGDVDSATKTLADMAAARKQATDEFKAGTIGNIMGMKDANGVKRQIASIFGMRDAVQQMKTLAARASKVPEAMDGLRRAIVEHIQDKYMGNATPDMNTSGSDARQIKGAAFQNFMRDNSAVLEQVFTPDEIKNIKAVAADINRSDRSMNAANVAGSDTAPKLHSVAASAVGSEGSLLSKLWKSVTLGGAAGPKGALVGAASAIGSHVIGNMRNAGLLHINDLVKEAMLNPDVAQALLQRASKVPNRGSELTLAHKLKRMSMLGAINGATQH